MLLRTLLICLEGQGWPVLLVPTLRNVAALSDLVGLDPL